MFRKFPSLENLHNVNTGFIDPDKYVTVREKVDGSNFSVVVEPDGSFRFASRNQLVDSNWNSLGEFINPEWVSTLVSKFGIGEYNVYGEVFSSKILRRIPYGETQVAFYALSKDGEFIEPSLAERYLIIAGFPVIPSVTMKFCDAINLDVERWKSGYADAVAEGIVIAPCYASSFSDRLFWIKKKSEKFLDKCMSMHKSANKEQDSEVEKLRTLFSQYINESRVLSYISKEGECNEKKLIGKYVSGIIEDAWEDFLKETPEVGTGDKRGIISGTGNGIAQVLLRRLV